MTRLAFTLFLALAATGAQADCFADYKAKRDDPLKLHYGVAEVSGACTKANARVELTPRVAVDGWTLLNVVSVFNDGGLEERKESAGAYFLRY